MVAAEPHPARPAVIRSKRVDAQHRQLRGNGYGPPGTVEASQPRRYRHGSAVARVPASSAGSPGRSSSPRPVRRRRRLPRAVRRTDAAHATGELGPLDRRRDRRARTGGAGRSSARCRTSRSPSTSTASPRGRSSTPGGRGSRSTRCWRTSRPTPRSSWRAATAATPRTCRWRTSSTAAPGWSTPTTASRWRPSTAGPPGCSCRTSTSGRAPSGCADCRCSTRTNPGFWETFGYHNYGDPWREQRYSDD